MVKRTKQLNRSEADYLETISHVENGNSEVFCSKCGDKGYTLIEVEDGNEVADICECTSNKMWQKIFADAGVSPEFFNRTIESDWNLQQDAYGNDLGVHKKRKKKIGEFMMKYIKNIPLFNVTGHKLVINRKDRPVLRINSILLVGGIKSGKSLLASIAVQQTLKAGLSAIMYDWSHLCDVLSEYKAKDEQNELVKDFKDTALVVIDGVHDYRIASPCFSLQLDRICRQRIASGKPIIITSDCTYDDISKGNSWQSLIGNCYVIKLPSPDKPEEKF